MTEPPTVEIATTSTAFQLAPDHVPKLQNVIDRACGSRAMYDKKPIALPSVRDRGIERRLRHSDREGTADLAEHLLGPDADAVEVEPADRVRGEQVQVLTGEALALARDREGRDPLRPVVGGAREHAVDIRVEIGRASCRERV